MPGAVADPQGAQGQEEQRVGPGEPLHHHAANRRRKGGQAMRTFLARQDCLLDPESVSAEDRIRLQLVEVTIRRDIPQAALDQAATVSMVNTGFAVLSEQIDQLAELLQNALPNIPRNIPGAKSRRAKSAKNSGSVSTRFITAVSGKGQARQTKQSLEKGATTTRREKRRSIRGE